MMVNSMEKVNTILQIQEKFMKVISLTIRWKEMVLLCGQIKLDTRVNLAMTK